MKYNGENFAGTLICVLIKEKISEVSLEDIQKAANDFLSEALKTDPKARLVVTEKDVKAVCKKKSNVLDYDKKTKTVKMKATSIDAYYHLHWGYEAMSLRLYGDDFGEKAYESYCVIKEWWFEIGWCEASSFFMQQLEFEFEYFLFTIFGHHDTMRLTNCAF